MGESLRQHTEEAEMFEEGDRHLHVAAMLRDIRERHGPAVPGGSPRDHGVSEHSGMGQPWVRYDAGFLHQAAITGNWLWSCINSTLYTICFTGNAQMTSPCEL